jgi:hypothetical protein
MPKKVPVLISDGLTGTSCAFALPNNKTRNSMKASFENGFCMATKFILVVTIQGLGFWGWVLGVTIFCDIVD